MSKDAHIIIIDWGSMTAATIQQMMRLAGEAGAASVKAIIFLSQMSIDEELFLRRITSILGTKNVYKDEKQKSHPHQRSIFDKAKLVDEPIDSQVVFLIRLILMRLL